LITAAAGTAEVLEKLATFKADSIDDGTIWTQWGKSVRPDQRVDEALLRDLRQLDKRLQEREHMPRAASHGLIGRYVYLSYLRHRDILSDKKLAKWGTAPEQLFSRNATLKAFRRVNEELQNWLNGSVFSMEEDAVSKITADQLKLVARVFAGDSPVGADAIQNTLFDVYDFSHIPIETLSCVYEQFLHDAKDSEGTSRGKKLGAYYTPIPLADYVLSELDHRRPLHIGMKVLDPACGSGAFLVQCYRRLIEQQRREAGRELRTAELRDLLTRHIFGIDRDDDACRVAELSLIMTLLDYVQLPDLESTNFKLPSLRNQNIYEGDFFDSSGIVADFLSQQQFDWIVGNPPWTEIKKKPANDHEHFAAYQWITSHSKMHPVSGNQIAEAFVWKAGEHLRTDGVCGLVLPAMTWFKKEATRFRQQLFAQRRVWCLANFANMAYVLFAGRSERPASVVFFESEVPEVDHAILTFAPFVAEQVANRPEKTNGRKVTWNIVIGANDVREIDNRDASNGESLTWKLAMWGTSRDHKLLEKLNTRFAGQELSSLCAIQLVGPHEGIQLRSAEDANNEEREFHPELVGRNKLLINTLRGAERLFVFPERSLVPIAENECYVRKRGGLMGRTVSFPPHIIVDASRRFAVFSDQFIAIPPCHIGIAGTEANDPLLRILSLLLSSDFCTYHQFLTSPQWGIDATRADLSALLGFPAPILDFSSDETRDWCDLQQQLAAESARQFDSDLGQLSQARRSQLVDELNDRVFRLLGLRKTERWLVEDFVDVNMELNKGKLSPEVIRLPRSDEQQAYLSALRDCLDSFLSADRGLRHKIEVLIDGQSALLSVSLMQSQTSIEPNVIPADDPASRSLKTIRDRLRKRHSQWVYFDRALKVYDRGVLYQFKPMQRLHWTRRQAVLDADDIIAETLSAKDPAESAVL